MSTDRRTFLKLSAAAGGALALSGSGATPLVAATSRATPSRERDTGKASAPLNILILGGTGFTGPEQVDYALERGHKVTLFNRNRTRPDMFKGKVDQLIGDLSADTSALKANGRNTNGLRPPLLLFFIDCRVRCR